ncbi:hypothetical protein F3Y22_tig00110020pilonHSYRG00425 [Hibiscus syriacus]|uniref:Shikimate O-hydroxycinnamoyltransferase n=1 Tax=Hibiscus syriacus TaxID=106335 RepID=A0A6A3BQ60_HIBSY|nr:hypothetical protein F3Y22_tig00110020pilonHSYRG00425 [Hibiscus syriacus]
MNSASDTIKPSTVSTFKLTADQLNTLKDKANAANAHSEGYLGNVIFPASQIARAGDLRIEPFIDTVKKINERLKVINDEYLRSSLDYMEKVSDLSALVRGHHTCRCPNLNIVPWIYLPLYDADFGWGRPLYMGPANVVHEGKFYIIPSPDNDGTLSLVTRLETSHFKLFEQLLYEF